MRTSIYVILVVLLSTASLSAIADTRSLGKGYRTLLSNYLIVSDITQRCPEIPQISLEPRVNVEKNFQKKIGIQNYNEFLFRLKQSNYRADAIKVVDALWEQIDGCEDPKLGQALERISTAHAEIFTRFVAEPAIIKAEPVPIPLRK